MSKCVSINTPNGLEPTAQANNVATAIKLALLQEQANQGFGWNAEEIITESGTWTAPVTGWYDVTLIGGGYGAYGFRSNEGLLYQVQGGNGGEIKNILKYYTKGEAIPVTIGSGGQALVDYSTNYDYSIPQGGITRFGNEYANFLNATVPQTITDDGVVGVRAVSPGAFGLYAITPNNAYKAFTDWSDYHYENCDAISYGGGGLAWVSYSFRPVSADSNPSNWGFGNGKQGCVILRYFDPSKVQLPTIDGEVLTPYIELLKRIDNLESILAESCTYNE